MLTRVPLHLSLAESQARELYGSCPGFVGALLLFDGPRRNARSITVWECRADMDSAAEQPRYGETMQSLASHFVDAPDVETWRLGASLFPVDAVPGSKSTGAAGVADDQTGRNAD